MTPMALLTLAALSLSPAFPAGSACMALCGRAPARTAHACCRPRVQRAAIAVRAPGCCRPGSPSPSRLVTVALEPAAKHSAAALTAGAPADASAAPRPIVGPTRLARFESPPHPRAFPAAILRI